MIKEHKLNRFDGGVVNDSRDTQENVCRMVSNFDIQNPRKLTPYHDSESGDASDSTDKIENFCVADNGSGQFILYGLGVVSGQAYVKLFIKNTFSDGTWSAATNGADSSLSRNVSLMVYYRKVGSKGTIYGLTGSRYVWSYAITSNTYTQQVYDLTSFSNSSNGLVHSKDDIMYFGVDNLIIKNNNGSFSTALTLPTHYYITSICEYGNFLAIGVSHLDGTNSRVFLWDRDATLTTLSETIDWGSGSLKVLEEIDGKLIGISIDSYYDGSNQIITRFNDLISFKYLQGNTAITFKKLFGTTSSQLPIAKQKINSKLHFMMSIVLNGVRREGVWGLGRSIEGSPFALMHERTPYNDTALGASGTYAGLLKNFFYTGDYLFITSTLRVSAGSFVTGQHYIIETVGTTDFTAIGASSNAVGVKFIATGAGTGTGIAAIYQLSKTNDVSSYTATSIYETTKKDFGDIALTKKLLSVTILTEYLPSGGQVVVKYKKDEETSFTTILTHSTANALRKTAVNIESSGDALPQFKEIEFRIESTGGAEITGLKIKAEFIDDDNS